MKEKGIKPVRPWQERPVCISSTTATFEPYVPPEGDGKVSTLSTAVSVALPQNFSVVGYISAVNSNIVSNKSMLYILHTYILYQSCLLQKKGAYPRKGT
ncbi:putative 39S ribosomal protein L45, mitochondrial [Portunus trituberculatus]|uniref:Putative 39S ribosomal protein L45, mitochondrial n=1 Tax=Portunus trituberculatus TaxID=210409 RepID=A0A5B7IDE4_PORTR|nr:putative 39S ribosomal protein L45, mitochondrial [Portunus trituberculatus]